jgi:sodium-dependent dicarboxylate transporter 2/3/5
MNPLSLEDVAPVVFTRKRLIGLLLGISLFIIVHLSPSWPDAVDPQGKAFALSREAKSALAIFFLAGVWWVTEVIPIGVTSLTVGMMQGLFLVRPATSAFKDFMDPSVVFIFASIVIGMVFSKTGLTRRVAYKMLNIVGERTSMIYLGCFIVTAALTLFMAHTAVAATIYPLLLAIYALYGARDETTKFGKGLFMGMAYVAGAGSIITLLGAARGAVAISFFKEITGMEVSFFQLTYYMAPIGVAMVFLLWGFFMVFFKPEKRIIPGLREKAKELNAGLGKISFEEVMAGVLVIALVTTMSLRSFIPALQAIDKSAIILISTVLFFVFRILDIDDLEQIPWNIILLFGGAMSIGYCMYETGAAQWLAVNWLTMFQNAHWFTFVMALSIFVLMMTNFIMNVAAISISIPVALAIAPYLGVTPDVVLFTSLVVAGMPFLLLVGAAPNAIAYDSKQFTSREFFMWGIPASILLLIVLGFFVRFIWPLMGMPVCM